LNGSIGLFFEWDSKLPRTLLAKRPRGICLTIEFHKDSLIFVPEEFSKEALESPKKEVSAVCGVSTECALLPSAVPNQKKKTKKKKRT
jgi:hypothetical protein